MSYDSTLANLVSAKLGKNWSVFDKLLDYLTVADCTASLALN